MPLIQPNAEDWPVTNPRKLSWFARFLSQRSGDLLDWHRFWFSTLRLGEQGWGVGSHGGCCHGKVVIYICGNLEDAIRQMQMVENGSYQDTDRKGSDHFDIRGKAVLCLEAQRFG